MRARVQAVGHAVAVGIGRRAQAPGIAQQRLDIGQPGIRQRAVAERLVGTQLPAERIVRPHGPVLADTQRRHGAGEIDVAVGVDVHQAQAARQEPVVSLLPGKQPFEAAPQRDDIGIAHAGAITVIGAVHQIAEEIEVVIERLAVTQTEQRPDAILAADQILVCPATAQQQPQFVLGHVRGMGRAAQCRHTGQQPDCVGLFHGDPVCK
ncbi:hypothetical protein [Thiobacillus sp.]|uniref:hypothetical protein n=1 Tax=Thiobacillus sp. TaxID=924 RepID=UPI0025EE65F1|nr:hypothetical protein [Thiobacillus sp.]